MELESVKVESRRKAKWWGGKRQYKLIYCSVLDLSKAVFCNGIEGRSVDYYTRRGLRS